MEILTSTGNGERSRGDRETIHIWNCGVDDQGAGVTKGAGAGKGETWPHFEGSTGAIGDEVTQAIALLLVNDLRVIGEGKRSGVGHDVRVHELKGGGARFARR